MNQVRKPSRGMIAVRVLLMTLLATLFCLAIGLFFGIVGFSLANLARGGGLNMQFAYFYVAFPLAATGFIVAFVLSLRSEVRRYRHARANYMEWQRAA